MDFYVDLAVAVLLRLIKDSRSRRKYYPALVKVFITLRTLFDDDAVFHDLVVEKDIRS